MGWTRSQEETDRRYRVMLGLLAPAGGQAVTLLDFDCGASHLYEYIRCHHRDDIRYSGLDVSARFLDLSAMTEYFETLVARVWARARQGIAFNVMSKYVDWERDDLFHVPMEALAGFLTRQISRHFVLRHDYGLHEYTAYVYRDPIDVGDLP